MAHNHKLVVSAADLVAGLRLKVRDDIVAGTEVRDELEAMLVSVGFLDGAPFKWIGLVWRYGLQNEAEPHYQGIDSKDGELAIAIELDANELREANREELKRLMAVATLRALVHVGRKYGLPSADLAERLEREGKTIDR